MNLLRNKTKRQKVFVPEPYTNKLGVTSVKLIENSLMMKEIITWLYVRVKFLIITWLFDTS